MVAVNERGERKGKTNMESKSACIFLNLPGHKRWDFDVPLPRRARITE